MKRDRHSFAESVFINCPFDKEYQPLFEAIVFTIVASGFHPFSAAAELDSGVVRLHKIEALIRRCQYGIHDLSRVELGAGTRLPRFNMPFELGLDLAAKTFGSGRLKGKRFLVLDAEPYRYQQFISDISGQDTHCHQGLPGQVIDIVRDWLQAVSKRQIPGPVVIESSYKRFVRWLQRGMSRRLLKFSGGSVDVISEAVPLRRPFVQRSTA